MNLAASIEKHQEWKLKFRHAIAHKTPVDADSICNDHKCELGAWLHGEGQTAHGKLASFIACTAKHKAFHAEAGAIARAINAGDYARAEQMLGAGTTYMKASSDVGVAISALRREAKI